MYSQNIGVVFEKKSCIKSNKKQLKTYHLRFLGNCNHDLMVYCGFELSYERSFT